MKIAGVRPESSICICSCETASGSAPANAGHDTRALQAWLGHKNIQHTVRYAELSPHRFKDFWRRERLWLSLAGADFLRLRCPIIDQRSNGASQSRSCAK
jgi:hypothetical protein